MPWTQFRVPLREGGWQTTGPYLISRPLLEEALAQESPDVSAHEMAVTARGLAKAAEILAGQFTLVATNVPYLGRGKQVQLLQDYCERGYPESKADLATCFIERSMEFCGAGCSSRKRSCQSPLKAVSWYPRGKRLDTDSEVGSACSAGFGVKA